jgi:epsilon-lactone hydrolase
MPDAVIAISPWVDLVTVPSEDYRKLDSKSDLVTTLQLLNHARRYIPDPCSDEYLRNPLVSPILGDYTFVCPIMVHYGGKEILAPEIERFIGRLRENQIDLTVVKEPLAPHMTPVLGFFFKEMSKRGVQAISSFIISKLY